MEFLVFASPTAKTVAGDTVSDDPAQKPDVDAATKAEWAREARDRRAARKRGEPKLQRVPSDTPAAKAARNYRAKKSRERQLRAAALDAAVQAPARAREILDAVIGQSAHSKLGSQPTTARDDATALLWRLARSGPPAQKIAALRELRRGGSQDADAPNPLAGVPTRELCERLMRLAIGLWGVAETQRMLGDAARNFISLEQAAAEFSESRRTLIIRQAPDAIPPTGEVQVVVSRPVDPAPPAGAQPAEQTAAELETADAPEPSAE